MISKDKICLVIKKEVKNILKLASIKYRVICKLTNTIVGNKKMNQAISYFTKVNFWKYGIGS